MLKLQLFCQALGGNFRLEVRPAKRGRIRKVVTSIDRSRRHHDRHAMQFKSLGLSWMRSWRNLIAMLCGLVVLLASPSVNGQTVPQRTPSPVVPAPVAAPGDRITADDVSSGDGSIAPVPAPSGAAGASLLAATPVTLNMVGAETGAPSPLPPEATLPRDLTPLGMLMSADIIVKAVMLGLLFASVLTWTISLVKAFELMSARRSLARAQEVLATARSLAAIVRPASDASPHVAQLIHAVKGELRRSPDLHDVDGIKERITARFERIEAGVGRRMMRATGILATIGATAPFVGLFGTVWGIMNSFIGISTLHTTNLAVVAPGIAEALLATAFGLAAAIPAVVIYNMFARWIAHYRALYADASMEILTLVSRDLSQPPTARLEPFDPRRRPAVMPTGEWPP
jgi:biopolymer transport protein ExbB